MDEKLQKHLAALGYASRREIERWIEAGRISVNGKPAQLGMRVSARDAILIDGKPIRKQSAVQQETRVLMYHKPVGEICSRADPEGRPSVYDKLPRIPNSRWIAIGRLDFNTSGLLLFTNNGELANRLMHPRYEVEREYAVRVLGEVSEEQLASLLQGVKLDDGMAKFATLSDAGGTGANHWYHVSLKEGRNREVRRLWEALGIQVSRLHRIRYGPVQLPRSLKVGRHQELEQATTDLLLQTVGLHAAAKSRADAGRPRPARRRRK